MEKPVEKKMVPLSASRIKLLQDCSWKYWVKYHLAVPDTSNDGSRRGTCAHLIFEVLLNERHRKYVDQILKEGTCLNIMSIYSLIVKQANKIELDLNGDVQPLSKTGTVKSNLKIIDEMIVIGLSFDFLEENKEIIESEYAFDIINEEPKYRILGFIDKVVKNGDAIEITDFKSSKKKFAGEELKSNVQAMMYSLAAKKKWPDSARRVMKFMFLRFPRSPFQHLEFTDQEIEGFEHYLAYLQTYISEFSEVNAISGFAADEVEKRWLCGKGPTFVCAFKNAFKYFSILDGTKVVKTSMYKEELEPLLKPNQEIKELEYKGCPKWHRHLMPKTKK